MSENGELRMSFEELWNQVEKLKVLPSTAILQIPKVLSEDTKEMLGRRSPQEVADLIRSAVSEIDRGSIETLDRLVRKRL